MGLRLKFNLGITVVFLVGLVISGVVARELLVNFARAEVERNANLMIETATAIRGFTVDEVRPHLQSQLDEVFLPQTVPAYAATQTLLRLPEQYADFTYKEATLNPTNPRDRAADWEADLVAAFKRDSTLTFLSGERATPSGRTLYIASPLKVGSEACLACHSTPDAAPASMIELYGDSNGFGWELNEIVGAQVVSVPVDVALNEANRTLWLFVSLLIGVFVVTYIVVNIMLARTVLRPVAALSITADKMSTGDFDIPEFSETRKDELGDLAVSFNRMRRSLRQAIKMIDT